MGMLLQQQELIEKLSNPLFTTWEVAEVLGITPDTVVKQCDKGVMGCYQYESGSQTDARRIPFSSIIDYARYHLVVKK
mgnify:CR=1 FL=1